MPCRKPVISNDGLEALGDGIIRIRKLVEVEEIGSQNPDYGFEANSQESGELCAQSDSTDRAGQ